MICKKIINYVTLLLCHEPSNNSSGSFGFNVKRVSSLYKVAKTSRFSADRENTGKHCERTNPHMRITTNNSRMLFKATISLLMSYCNQVSQQLVSIHRINFFFLQMYCTYSSASIHSAHAATIWQFC